MKRAVVAAIVVVILTSAVSAADIRVPWQCRLFAATHSYNGLPSSMSVEEMESKLDRLKAEAPNAIGARSCINAAAAAIKKAKRDRAKADAPFRCTSRQYEAGECYPQTER